MYNGNISETYWLSSTDNTVRKYGYRYDKLNRLKDAYFQQPYSFDYNCQSYNEHLQYDKNGNILTLNRYSRLENFPAAVEIDDLEYFYQGNQLTKVTDLSGYPQGFKDDSDGTNDDIDDYRYDAFGNMYRDENKQIGFISYNHLNLPTEIQFQNGSTISYLYNAAGQKLRKLVSDMSTGGVSTTEYLDGFQYNNFILQFFSHPEGYVLNTPDKNGNPSFDYVYQYKDHLGNIRMNFVYAKGENDFILKVLEENHYYPFGLKHENYNTERRKMAWDVKLEGGEEIDFKKLQQVPNSGYQYKYNGKEWQDELGLNTIAMDFRQYDPAIGRFNGMDRLTELVPGMSPYRFGFNNPVYWSDPSGLFENNGDNKIKGWVNTGKSVFWDPDVNNQEEIDKKYEGKGYVYVPDYEEIVDANGNTRQLLPDGTAAYVLDDVEVVATLRTQSNDDSEFDMFVNRYFQTYGLLLSSGGEYGRRWYERGNYTQTNGNQGNFNDRPFKRLSNNAKANYNKALDLKRLSKAGTIVTFGSIAYDVLDDGNIKSSTVVNAAILTVTLLFPPTAILAVGYGVADYFFDFSGKIDSNFGEIKTGLYD